MDEKRTNSTVRIAAVGAALVAAILILGTIWTGRSARKDAVDAVRSVSMLYMDELAGRRVRVVEDNLNENIRIIRIAVDLIDEAEDLRDLEHMRSYQRYMKTLFNLDRFAFVDEDGLVYTADEGITDEIGQYAFDPETLSEPEISVKNLETAAKKVVIAAPIRDRGYTINGKALVACFEEIDMDVMLQGVSLRSQDSETTFCNIYTGSGTALSNTVLGGLAVEDNLLEALERADYEGGYSYGQIERDFREGNRGVAAFSYNGVQETLSYNPVKGTDWLLTYLVRDSVISERISTVSGGIIRRSLLMTGLTVLVLGLMLTFIISQIRRNARLLIEKETLETESRAKEQQIALQEELLEQQTRQEQQASMIGALSSDYRSVYYVDLDKDEAVCYREDRRFVEAPAEGDRFPFLRDFTDFADNHVTEDYREGFLRFIQPDHIRAELLRQPLITYRFLEDRDGVETYAMLRIADVRHLEEPGDNSIRSVGVCFADIDEEMRASLAQQQVLSDALASAEQANRAKTAFLSNMSHEIRTPMNAIIGLDGLALRNGDLAPETKEYLEKIGESARHLLGLINDILDMSRIESGRIVLRHEEFSFRSMLEQINTMVMTQCQEKGLTYECSTIGGVSDYYIGDDMKLKQVLINILSNAIKFTDAPGRITLTVERTASFEDQSTLKFIVKDTGIGMDKSFIPRIFDSFSQENSGRSNIYGSTGLGMAITKNIVTLMNGTISVESEKGVGSEFTVVVPLKNSDHTGPATSYIKPKDMRVLIVDDEEIAAEHARIVLDEVGIKAETAYSGSDALTMLEVAHTKHMPYNLVLLDWKMPEMDGLEVTREIRKRYDKETTVIILTSFNWDEIMDEALHIGVDSFLAKPLFASNVIDEFERIARKNNMRLFREKRRADLNGRRILLAEDILINAEIMKQILEIKGVRIDHAVNGRIALELFSGSEPGTYDAILMDVRMPEMDGLEATEAIRALDREDARTIPIVAMTANAFDEDVQRSLQVGMNAHLSKPVEPEHLYQTLEELIWEADEAGKTEV